MLLEEFMLTDMRKLKFKIYLIIDSSDKLQIKSSSIIADSAITNYFYHRNK